MYSSSKLIDKFSEEQKEQLEQLKEEKITNEIDRLNFNDDVFARFLTSANFDFEKAGKMFSKFLEWRKEHHVNMILVLFFIF